MAAKKTISVTVTNAAGVVYSWKCQHAAVRTTRQGEVFLDLYGSGHGDFTIAVAVGSKVEVKP